MERRKTHIAMDRETTEEALARLQRVAGSDDYGPQPLSRTEARKLKAEVEQLSDDELRGRSRIINREQTRRYALAHIENQKEKEAEKARVDAELEERLAAAQQRLVVLGLDDLFKVAADETWPVRHLYFAIAKSGSRAGQTGEEIALEILTRLEAMTN
jgi:hypothetical protein